MPPWRERAGGGDVCGNFLHLEVADPVSWRVAYDMTNASPDGWVAALLASPVFCFRMGPVAAQRALASVGGRDERALALLLAAQGRELKQGSELTPRLKALITADHGR